MDEFEQHMAEYFKSQQQRWHCGHFNDEEIAADMANEARRWTLEQEKQSNDR